MTRIGTTTDPCCHIRKHPAQHRDPSDADEILHRRTIHEYERHPHYEVHPYHGTKTAHHPVATGLNVADRPRDLHTPRSADVQLAARLPQVGRSSPALSGNDGVRPG